MSRLWELPVTPVSPLRTLGDAAWALLVLCGELEGGEGSGHFRAEIGRGGRGQEGAPGEGVLGRREELRACRGRGQHADSTPRRPLSLTQMAPLVMARRQNGPAWLLSCLGYMQAWLVLKWGSGAAALRGD